MRQIGRPLGERAADLFSGAALAYGLTACAVLVIVLLAPAFAETRWDAAFAVTQGDPLVGHSRPRRGIVVAFQLRQ